MKQLVILLFLVGFTTNCHYTHSIECINVQGEKVCFVREVWGLNGDRVALTKSDNVCHEPSIENDYISTSLRSTEIIDYRIVDGKLYIYDEPMNTPKNPFPVEVIIERRNPLEFIPEFRESLKKDGWIEKEYQKADLGSNKMTWCFNDIF